MPPILRIPLLLDLLGERLDPGGAERRIPGPDEVDVAPELALPADLPARLDLRDDPRARAQAVHRGHRREQLLVRCELARVAR